MTGAGGGSEPAARRYSTFSAFFFVAFAASDALTESAATRVDEVFPHSAMITVLKDRPKDATIRGKDGLHCYPGRATCAIVRGDYLIEVADWNGALSDTEVRRIADGLDLVDLTDQKTWVPLTN